MKKGDLVRKAGGLHSTAPVGVVLHHAGPTRIENFHKFLVYWDYNNTKLWETYHSLERVIEATNQSNQTVLAYSADPM